MTLRAGLIAAIAVVGADRIVKWWMIGVVEDRGGIVITPFFNLVLARNTGISFGLGNDGTLPPWLLAGVAFVIAAGLVWWLVRARTLWLSLALGLVIGGAVGNAIDRLLWGFVADFFDFHALGYHWPAFNVADMAVVGGVGMILLEGIATRPRRHK
ncbi:MAG TPA: signal peptidase II [Alphaproteobacteria bacterium]|jgi:signal peptidase II|nr:signal peptidase II [Alphaproteobacteria bacterium]